MDTVGCINLCCEGLPCILQCAIGIPVFYHYMPEASPGYSRMSPDRAKCPLGCKISNNWKPQVQKDFFIFYLHLNFKCIRSSSNSQSHCCTFDILCYLGRHFLLRNVKMFSLFSLFITMAPNYCSEMTHTTKSSLLKPRWISYPLLKNLCIMNQRLLVLQGRVGSLPLLSS